MKITPESDLRLLKRLEWSSTQYGQGTGFMGSGNDGVAFPACPICGGIKPKTGAECEFNERAIGHKGSCVLRRRIDAAVEGR